jgi:2-oxo-3-hexenedioate decarboxylase
MQKTDLQALAGEIFGAWKSGSAIGLPPSARDAGFDVAQAYEVDAHFAALRMAQEHGIVGRKVGYANRALWRVLKLESLVWSYMYDDTVLDGAKEVSVGRYVSPRIEPEVVIKIGPDASTWEWIAMGFEIIDCPFPNWEFKPADFIAASGLHCALVVGPHLKVEPEMMPRLTEQLAAFKLQLVRHGEAVEEGGGRNSLKSPALCLAELNRITPLGAGEIISTGTLTAAQPIAPGEHWEIRLDGLDLQPVEVRLNP